MIQIKRHPSQFPIELAGLHCCGIQEIHGIDQKLDGSFLTPEEILAATANERFEYEETCGMYIFSSAIYPYRVAAELQKYIRNFDLGPVSEPIKFENPNTTNTIWMYTWQVKDAQFGEWWNKVEFPNNQNEWLKTSSSYGG